ncbi:unnamed protein product [Penicillium salamii]|uniref:Ankyrin n=1 Tax=Penicillium salamii TaxID=1612424 RepID=A0A9W4IWJ9_9EURO|nr:unnamed protein product [Penicillium salamii]CAG7966339.1 unnamed protein product [Penicillium salamii]CAG7994076.1 unnamed protein product [Penicillium salamii]CAG8018218.1 unnamed protein product [Penicillium salamii]CAG8275104.1 unnamed protein product [Penicillium salamii]
MSLFGPSPADTESWTLPVWGVVFDRLTSGSVATKHFNTTSGKAIGERTARQQIEWATKLDLPGLKQKTIDTILNRFTGFSLGVRYMEESKIHAIHRLIEEDAPLREKTVAWLEKEETRDMFLSMIRSYDSYEEAMKDIKKVKDWPREKDNHPFKTNPAYDAAVKCHKCLSFLVEEGFVTINGYDLSGRNWLEAGFNGNNVELLAVVVANMDPADLTKPRDIREPDSSGNHILLSLAGHNAFEAFELALNKMIKAGIIGKSELKEIFHPAAMHELCAIAPPSVAEALYAKGINIGNVEHQHHPLGGQLDGSWHMAAAFNPKARAMVEWLGKFSTLSSSNRNHINETPLMYAAKSNQYGAIRWLCKNSDPTLPQWEGGPPAHALLCAAKSSYQTSTEIFSVILDHIPKQIMTLEYGKICGTEIAAGLVQHKELLRKRQIADPIQADMERMQVFKMQALISRLPRAWPGSTWHLALEAYASDNGVSVLKHSMATEPRRTRSNSSRRRGPKSARLGLESDDDDNDDASLTGLSGLALSGQTSLRRSNAVRRRGRPSDRSSSRTRDTALGRTRDSNNMVSKSVRRRQTDR